LNREQKKNAKIARSITNPRYIIWDSEADTSSGIHRPNLIVADILRVDDSHEYEKSFREKKIFEGYDCLKEFCLWLFSEENANSTAIAHNQAGYDGKFVLSYCLNACLPPSKIIKQGNRISYMYFSKFHLRFIDSLSFFLCPLAKLSETFEIDTLKGHFPHKFNIAENQNYIGDIPNEDMFFARNMKPDDYKDFKVHHNFKKVLMQLTNTQWNFREEFIKYCIADVVVLAKSVLKFRKLLLGDGILNVDPFRYTTLASLCMAIFNNRFLPDKTIVGNGGNKPTSKVCNEWLMYLDDKHLIPEVPLVCENVENKKYYKNPYHTFHADGFNLKNQLVN
jgi:hypothetical protein